MKEKTQQQAREEILGLVAEYCEKYHLENKKKYEPGDRIPYASRVYDAKEMVNLVDSALEFWLTSGRYTEAFEEEFSRYLGVRYCSLVNSGSSANLLAFMALTSPLLGERQVKRGDEIITVAAGFPTTVTPMIQYGAVPVFVDVTIPQYNIDVTQLEKAYSERTKAVMIAHTLGNPFDLKAVKEFCGRYGLWLVEDNCDALGSRYTLDGEDRLTGTIGDIGTSSFYPPHHMTMGEGGAGDCRQGGSFADHLIGRLHIPVFYLLYKAGNINGHRTALDTLGIFAVNAPCRFFHSFFFIVAKAYLIKIGCPNLCILFSHRNLFQYVHSLPLFCAAFLRIPGLCMPRRHKPMVWKFILQTLLLSAISASSVMGLSLFCLKESPALRSLIDLLALHGLVKVHLMPVKLRSVHAGKFHLSPDRYAAGAAHAGAVHHDRV